jgi:hypothetical protein
VAGTYVPPAPTWALLNTGDPAITHYTAGTWILEATGPTTLQLRMTSAGFLTASMVHPVGGCVTQPVSIATTFGFLSTVGATLQAPFCPAPFGAGSTVTVSVADFATVPPTPVLFTCISTGNNGHVCQRR